MSERGAILILVFSLWCLVLWGAEAWRAIRVRKEKN